MNIWNPGPSLDGDVVPGLPLRGGVMFDVPADAQVAYWVVDLGLFTGDPVVYEINLGG